MCQQCAEEWGPEIVDRVHAFCKEWPDAEFGPAHIVLSDFNCEPHHIRWCLGLIAGELQRRGVEAAAPRHLDEAGGITDLLEKRTLGTADFYADCDTDELRATARFLREWLLPRVVEG